MYFVKQKQQFKVMAPNAMISLCKTVTGLLT